MFSNDKGNNIGVSLNEEHGKLLYAEEIRKAGYFLSDNMVENSSTSQIFSAAMTIKCKKMFLEHNPVDFNNNVGSDNFLTAKSGLQEKIAYALYFAQEFVDKALNEEIGNYVYQNKEEIEYNEIYGRFFKTFVIGIMMIRELEYITHFHNLHKDKENYADNLPVISQSASEVKFIVEIRAPKRSYDTIIASYRGVTFSMIFGQTMIIEDNKMIIRRDYIHHRQLRNMSAPVQAFNDLVENTWNSFLNHVSAEYIPVDKMK